MTSDPWGPGPNQLPPPFRPSGQSNYYPQFNRNTSPKPPGLAPTVIVTLLAGLFGLIPASLHSSRARQLGLDGGRYWKAFGITFGSVFAAQLLIVGGIIAAGLFGANLFRLPGNPSAETGTRPGPASTWTMDAVPPAATAPRGLTPSGGPSLRERTGREEPTRAPGMVSVVAESTGRPCASTTEPSEWGGYPLARCRTWKPSTGLLTGAPLGTGSKAITCQADLQEANPIYTAGQTNTWWVWTQANDGTWDWFPETAMAEGASNQPINGIARCQ